MTKLYQHICRDQFLWSQQTKKMIVTSHAKVIFVSYWNLKTKQSRGTFPRVCLGPSVLPSVLSFWKPVFWMTYGIYWRVGGHDHQGQRSSMVHVLDMVSILCDVLLMKLERNNPVFGGAQCITLWLYAHVAHMYTQTHIY